MEEILNTWLFDPVVGKLVTAALFVLIVLGIVRYSQRVMGRYVEDDQRRYRLRKLVTLFGYVLAILLISLVYSDKLAGLTVLLGVLGAGIAFALQEIIVSIAGWVALSVGRLYDVGDRVELSGIKGDVIDIGVLRTTLMECGGWINGDQYSGRIVRIGNSAIFKDPVFNYSSDFPFLWDEIIVPISFGSDYEAARALFLQVLIDETGEHARHLEDDWRKMTSKFLIEHAQLQPIVTLQITNDWVEFTLRYVVEYKQRQSTRDRISSGVLKVLESNDEIVLGASGLEVASIPPLEVEIQKGE